MALMSIRADFQSTVDEFIADLTSFATGSYLKEDEKEFWDQPFDPAVLPQLRSLLEGFLDNLDNVPDDPGGETIAAVAAPFVESLEAFNAAHAGAVIEPEEKEDLAAFMRDAAAATGADDEALRALPELD